MDLFDRAACFAIEKHSGQIRKRNFAPYILHPMEVAAIVGTMTADQEVLAAAMLHDTVEDTDTTFEEITALFGQRVTGLVATETEDKRDDRPKEETWKIRKEESLAELKNAKDIAVKMLWLGDKLANMRSFYLSYQKEGDALWNHFHQKDPKEQKWYYESIAKCLSELKEFDAYKEYMNLMSIIFQNVQ